MPTPEGQPLFELATDIRAEQRRRWLERDRVDVEALLERARRLRDDPECVLDLIYGEILLREEFGDSPGLDEYARRFPELSDRLATLFEVHRAIESGRLLSTADAEITVGDPNRDSGRDSTIPIVAGYELLDELGRGGMGVVYRARQLSLDRPVALKMILAGDQAGRSQVARFRAEASAIARLHHPNIVQIHDVGEQDGRPFLCLELIGGGSLAQHLGGVPQPPDRAAGMVRTLAKAIEAAPPRGDHPPRPQAVQHPPDDRRHAQDHRLRGSPSRSTATGP